MCVGVFIYLVDKNMQGTHVCGSILVAKNPFTNINLRDVQIKNVVNTFVSNPRKLYKTEIIHPKLSS